MCLGILLGIAGERPSVGSEVTLWGAACAVKSHLDLSGLKDVGI